MEKSQGSTQPESSAADQFALAEKLFVKLWQPKSGTQDEPLAAMCFQASRSFCRVAAQVHEGRTPEEIINPQ